ncbi:MAG: branched-chain amino acid ABC transporter permease [Pararhodobacter sp.]
MSAASPRPAARRSLPAAAPPGDPSVGAHLGLAAALLLLPAVASGFILVQIGAQSLILGLLALSLMVLAGYGGMISLAQITVAGIAGYTVAILGENSVAVHGFGWPWWLTVPVAITFAALGAALIGWISVRTQGIYTIMITLAIATAMSLFAQQNYTLFNGFEGFAGIPAPTLFGQRLRAPMAFYYLCLGVAALCYVAVLYGARSTFGLGLQATRDNQRRMRALGFDTTAHKVFAWFLAGIIAGLAGVLLVWFQGRISPGTIGVAAAINILVIAVVGGLRHPIGPFLGAVVVVLIQTFATDVVGAARHNTLIGITFLVIVYFSPDGLLGLWSRLQGQFRQNPLRPGDGA